MTKSSDLYCADMKAKLRQTAELLDAIHVMLDDGDDTGCEGTIVVSAGPWMRLRDAYAVLTGFEIGSVLQVPAQTVGQRESIYDRHGLVQVVGRRGDLIPRRRHWRYSS